MYPRTGPHTNSPALNVRIGCDATMVLAQLIAVVGTTVTDVTVAVAVSFTSVFGGFSDAMAGNSISMFGVE